jgi:hypothetical protein
MARQATDEWYDLAEFLDLRDVEHAEGRFDELDGVVEDGLSIVTIDDLLDGPDL